MQLARIGLIWCVSTAAAFGCVAEGDKPLSRLTEQEDGGPIVRLDGGIQEEAGEITPPDPHALIGIDPTRGPWRGGTRAIVRGNGFGSDARVWFDEVEVDSSDVLPIDPGRVQVTVPPGTPGRVALAIQNGDDASTRRSLPGAYTYEDFYADPAKGPTSGGTLITLHGNGTGWDESTQVSIDRQPCEIVSVTSAEELTCRTPPGTPGTKPIEISGGDGSESRVLGGFSYVDSDNGFRGGLSGEPLAGELTVIVLDNYEGAAVPGASVIAGDDLASAVLGQTNGSGLALLNDPSLTGARSVTVAKKCFQPTTFVDVPVDTVTVYLDPILAPGCADGSGELPPSGGSFAYAANLEGELIWDGRREFQRGGWTNVPDPKGADEELVAYVFPLSDDPTEPFRLPQLYQAVTPQALGTTGYAFRISSSAGNLALYAVAGIENRSFDPPLFLAYAMGIAKGVVAEPGRTTEEIYIPVNLPLDRALRLDVRAPAPTPRGPDRIVADVSIRIGELGFAVLPGGHQSALLPLDGTLDFVGLPLLSGALAGAEYVATAKAQTGSSGATPHSIIGSLTSTVAGQSLLVSGFVEVPVLTAPAANTVWTGTELGVDWAPGGPDVDLVYYEIQSGNGLSNWTVAVPNQKKQIRLPDLAALNPDLALFRGPVLILVTAARIANFDYGALRYRDLGRAGWDAYAQDVYYAQY